MLWQSVKVIAFVPGSRSLPLTTSPQPSATPSGSPLRAASGLGPSHHRRRQCARAFPRLLLQQTSHLLSACCPHCGRAWTGPTCDELVVLLHALPAQACLRLLLAGLCLLLCKMARRPRRSCLWGALPTREQRGSARCGLCWPAWAKGLPHLYKSPVKKVGTGP